MRTSKAYFRIDVSEIKRKFYINKGVLLKKIMFGDLTRELKKYKRI